MYRKSSFTPSSFFGPRGALGSSFSSSFFFPPRSALSGFAGTGGPSGSGLGFSSGIDEIPGWDGHPNLRTYLRNRSARPAVWVLADPFAGDPLHVLDEPRGHSQSAGLGFNEQVGQFGVGRRVQRVRDPQAREPRDPVPDLGDDDGLVVRRLA